MCFTLEGAREYLLNRIFMRIRLAYVSLYDICNQPPSVVIIYSLINYVEDIVPVL